MNYYNENDPKAAAWLRELISAGCISPGEVDERSIAEVQPTDLRGYVQCHFFAGIGGWSYALRLAGWPDDEPVWTGSCPCQPFSCAGQQRGTRDARHLWPKWLRLIAETNGLYGVPVVFGEQVASAAGRQWLGGVCASLEALGYQFGAADLCAASVGADHIRQRLWWVAESGSQLTRRQLQRPGEGVEEIGERASDQSGGSSSVSRLADAYEGQRGRLTDGQGCQRDGAQAGWQQGDGIAESSSKPGGLEHTIKPGLERYARDGNHRNEPGRLNPAEDRSATSAGSHGAWSNFDIIPCADGKARRIESGSFPLPYGIPGRVGLLRGYGNAIVPQVAAEFIKSYLETKL